MSDTNENTPANETSAENLQGNGGMMSFDAASGIAEAFEKLQIAPEPPASEPSAPAPAEPAVVELIFSPPTPVKPVSLVVPMRTLPLIKLVLVPPSSALKISVFV